MVSDSAAEIAASSAVRFINRNGLEQFNEQFKNTKDETIKEKIREKVACPDCRQGLFYNQREDIFFCPACNDE